MLHQHGHHHVDEHELGGEHEGDKVHGRDKLKAWIAGIVHISAVVWWTLPQCILVRQRMRRGWSRVVLGEREQNIRYHKCHSLVKKLLLEYLESGGDDEKKSRVKI